MYKLLDRMNIFSKVVRHKTNIKKSVAFLYANDKYMVKEILSTKTSTFFDKPKYIPEKRQYSANLMGNLDISTYKLESRFHLFLSIWTKLNFI